MNYKTNSMVFIKIIFLECRGAHRASGNIPLKEKGRKIRYRLSPFVKCVCVCVYVFVPYIGNIAEQAI